MGIKILDIDTQLCVSTNKPNPELIDTITSRRRRNRKPIGGLWTSTKYTDNEIPTSEWIEWSRGNISKYEKDTYYVWQLLISNPCKVLIINDKSDVIKYSQSYTNIYGDKEYEFKWDYIFNELDCDAMWLTKKGITNLSGIFVSDKYAMRSWDVESMLWSNWKFENVEKLREL